MKKRVIAALILTCLTPMAMAYTTFGTPDCGQWITDKSNIKKAWLVGYVSGLSAMHAMNNRKDDPLSQINSIDQIFVWMDNYCQNNPLSKLNDGGGNLFIDLMLKTEKK